MELHKDMQQLEVVVIFNAQTKNKYIWCDNIELFINYQMIEMNNRKNIALALSALFRSIG